MNTSKEIHQESLNHASEERQKRQHTEEIELQNLLEKLRTVYAGTHPYDKSKNNLSQRFRSVIAGLLIFGLVNNAPIFAADNVLSQDYVAPQPEITLEAAQAEPETQDIVVPKTASTADDFVTAGALSAATVAETAGRAFYVSSSGSDSNSGTDGAEWKTLSYAVSQLKAGDTLFIKEGTYTKMNAAFSSSGTSDAYITIKGIGNVVIDGVNMTTISGYTVASSFTPTFDTKGHDYIRFENLTVKNSRDAVEVSPGSSYIEIDGLRSDGNHFAVKINGGDHVTVRNAVVTNSRNGFRTEAAGGITPTDILYENIDVSGSKDVYSGFEPAYRNGDGFILEAGNRITIRNVVSHDNWDGGFDLKANNVLLEHVEVYGNKNNFKIWGSGIVVKDSLSHDAKIRVDDPVAGEGYGVNNRMGQIRFINTTFANNENADIRADNDGGPSSTILENCIIMRTHSSGALYTHDGGSLTEKNNLWYSSTKANAGFTLDASSAWADPKFVNVPSRDYHLQAGSPAIDFGSTAFAIGSSDYESRTRVVGNNIDVGAYEYQASTPTDTVAPVISTVASNSITASGAMINWVTNEASDSQVEYRALGSTNWVATSLNAAMLTNHSVALSGLNAATVYEFRVKSKDQYGNLATQSVVSSFTTLAIVVIPPTTTCTTAMCGVAAGQTVNGTIKVQPNLTLNPSVRKVSYYLNGTLSSREYTSPFVWGGTGFDTTKLADGAYTLSGAYTTSAGDQNFSISFVVKNNGTVDTAAPVISAVASANVTTGGATINWTTNEVSDSQIEYRAQGATAWATTGINSTMTMNHSVVLSGLVSGTTYEFRVKSKDQAGNLAVQSTISSFRTLTPVVTCTTAICGVASGQTVSGTIKVQPNLTLNPDIRKVAYYLNGTLVSREYSAPFGVNGGAGIDTTKMADGTYTLSGAYTTATGDKAFTITFTVKNTSAPVVTTTSTVCATAMCGVTSGQTVSGTIKIQPNLNLNPSVKKVAYYVNGTLSTREYNSPFTWGGTSGFDTRRLANGTYTISGAYTTAAGDVSFSFTVTVRN